MIDFQPPRGQVHRRLAVLGLCLMPTLWGCDSLPSPVSSPVPPAFAQHAQEFRATHRSPATGLLADESFDLGSYRVSDVRRLVDRHSSIQLGGYGTESVSAGYRYRVSQGDALWDGRCDLKARERAITALGGAFSEGESSLRCDCVSGEQHALLELGQDGALNQGLLRLDQRSYRVSALSTDALGPTTLPSAGMLVEGADGAQAAVALGRPGAVWLGHTLPGTAQGPAVCTLVGLMLYVQP